MFGDNIFRTNTLKQNFYSDFSTLVRPSSNYFIAVRHKKTSIPENRFANIRWRVELFCKGSLRFFPNELRTVYSTNDIWAIIIRETSD